LEHQVKQVKSEKMLPAIQKSVLPDAFSTGRLLAWAEVPKDQRKTKRMKTMVVMMNRD
jgi:hypothetical protein